MTALLVQKPVKCGDLTTINVDFIDLLGDGTQLVALGASRIYDASALGNVAAVSPFGQLLVSSDSGKPAYRYCLLAFAMVAAPTDVIVIQGSGTKTVRLKRIMITGQATAQGSMPVQLVRRSTPGTLGSAVLSAITAAKHDINDGAATATVSSVGTANYGTPGTSAGVEAVGRLGMSALATGVGGQGVTWDFATRQDKAMVLRGTSDFLCINFNGAAIPSGGVVDFEIEAEEDGS